ncbi:MAG: D-alanine--D-alanine ligase [Patescibacteria group bacterium]
MTYQDLLHKKIGVLFGGKSTERSTSLRSGEDAYQALQELGCTNVLNIDLGDQPIFQILDSGIEYAFLASHGADYEDGKLQGALELLGIPYTGCGVLSSAVGFHKVSTKMIARGIHIPTPDWFLLNVQNHLAELSFDGPYIIKPPAQGSSIDVYKVESREKLSKLADSMLQTHGEVLVEEFIPGRDLTIGAVGNPGKVRVLPILEIHTPSGIYDRQGKFGDETTYIVPAQVEEDVRKNAEEMVAKLYTALQCRAVTRMDFRLDGDDLYFIEANTIPGMNRTSSNMSHILRAAGITYHDFVKGILLDSFCTE